MAKKAKKAKKEKGARTWKMVGKVVPLAAGIATTKALDTVWRASTGKTPPNEPENPEVAGREALIWAGATGLAMGIAKAYSLRRLATYWVKSTGKLPPGMGVATDPEKAGKLVREA